MIASDSDLVARVILRDDRAAFGELVQRHQSDVRRFLRHLNRGDAAQADDLAQETFVQAYRGIAGYRGDGSFKTWLFGIAHNHYRNARRRQKVEWQSEGWLAEISVDSAVRASELKQDLAAAFKQLSPEEQTAVYLSYQQGLSHSECAGVTRWPLGTVKTHLARAKEKLRTHLTAWNPLT